MVVNTAEIGNKVQADEEDGDSAKDAVKEESQAETSQVPVSYTHLTLPTILLV